MDNLPELRDIHLPQIGNFAFPPAYGWWVLLAILLATFLLWELVLMFLQKSKKRYALRVLEEYPHNSLKAAAQMSELMRRVCVFKYKNAVSLYGAPWIEFLNSHTDKKMDEKTAQFLLNAPYVSAESEAYTSEDIVKLHDFCKNWIGENL